MQPACIGRIWFEIEIQGKPAGIQQRYLGVSAIELGYKIVKAVQQLEDHRVATVKHPLYPSAIDSLPCIIGSFQESVPFGGRQVFAVTVLVVKGIHAADLSSFRLC